MKCMLIFLFLLVFGVVFAMVPSYVDFHLELNWIHHDQIFTDLGGTLTVTNNGPIAWEFENNLGYLGHIRINGLSSVGTFWMPYHLTLPPQHQYTTDVMGEAEYLGTGLHNAQACLSYTLYNWEPVGNIIPFSVDEILDDYDELDWELVIHDQTNKLINATLVATNDSYYFWKRSLPYGIEMMLGLDGGEPVFLQPPDAHYVYIGPHSSIGFDATYTADQDFTPGYHSLQAYIMDDVPIPVGEPILFYIAPSGNNDGVLEPSLSADLYPNPMNSLSLLRIGSKDSQICKLSIYDLRGRQVCLREGLALCKGRTEVPLREVLPADLNPGIYFLRLSTPTDEINIKAVVAK